MRRRRGTILVGLTPVDPAPAGTIFEPPAALMSHPAPERYTSELVPFGSVERCPKCLAPSGKSSTTYHHALSEGSSWAAGVDRWGCGDDREHLHRSCSVCGFSWNEQVAGR